MVERFGAELVRQGIIDQSALDDALRLRREEGRLLATGLLERGHLRRGALLQAMARILGVPPAPPSLVRHPDPQLLSFFDLGALRRLSALPYGRDPDGTILVAVADPEGMPEARALEAGGEGGPIGLRVAVEPDVRAGFEALGVDLGEADEVAAPPAIEAPPAPPVEPPGAPTGAPAAPVAPAAADLRPVPVALTPADVGREVRFAHEGEVAFARATGFDQAKTALFRLDEIARAERRARSEKEEGGAPEGRGAGAGEAPAREGEASPAPARPVTESNTVAPPASAALPAQGQPERAPAPAAAQPGPVFRDEAEVAFARATGFEKERTALFRLDELAGTEAARAADGEGQEDGLPAPPDAPSLAAAAEKLFEATNEGGVARHLLKFYETYFPRVVVLTRHGDVLRGLLARGIDLSGPQLAQLRFPIGPFAELFETGTALYGPPPGGQELEPFYAALGEPAAHVFVVPIATSAGPPWLLFADHGGSVDRYDDVHDLERMAREAALALDLLRQKGERREASLPERT